MRILLIRHAEPEKNTLSEKGFKEAKLLGEYYKDFQYKTLYSSPLPRAYLTAKEFANGKNFIICDWLAEFYHPVIIDNNEMFNWDFVPSLLEKYPQIVKENYLDFEPFKKANIGKEYNEVCSKFDELLKEQGYVRDNLNYKVIKSNKDTIVIVCHMCMMSVLLSHLTGMPYTTIIQHFFACPSSITIIQSEEREEGIAQFRIREFGNIDHLKVNKESFSKHGSYCETFDSFDERHHW